jgi:curved DNA-binding protein CbpA
MEKRKLARIPKRLSVRFGTSQLQHAGFTEDLSPEGMFIKSQVVFKPGTPLLIEVKLSQSKVVSLKGVVKWAKSVPPALIRYTKKAGFGVHLEEIPELYVQFLTESNSGARVAPPRVAPKTASAPVEAAEKNGRADSAGDALNGQEIVKAYDALQGQNHYQILRVATTATHVEIKRAYYSVAKRFHPDHFHDTANPVGLEQVKTIFCRVNEAYRVLSSDAHRRTYDFELSVNKLGLGRKEHSGRSGAVQEVQLGRQALKERKFPTAVYYFERAVKMFPDKSDHHDLLAQALSSLPQRKRDAEQHYKKAIALEPARTEYYYHFGNFYDTEGFPSRALQQFEAAREWDPDNQDILMAIARLKGK